MSSDEQTVTKTSEEEATNTATSTTATEDLVEKKVSEDIVKAKELYSHGSRNFLVKSFAEAANELSKVCECYEHFYGDLADELGMPYLLYAKSLIGLALDENKVIDVPDEEEYDDQEEYDQEEEYYDQEEECDDQEEEYDDQEEEMSATASTNGATSDRKKLENETKEDADTTAAEDADKKEEDGKPEKMEVDSKVTSTGDDDRVKKEPEDEAEKRVNGTTSDVNEMPQTLSTDDGEMPSTSNGDGADEEEYYEEYYDEYDAASNLQLAWEVLELASKIFSRQGERGLPNLAEVKTELGNIEFENNILDSARDDYEEALAIYKQLPNNYRRAKAEIHYKIGLTFLMQQQNKEGAASLKEACTLIAGEIDEIKAKPELSEKDKNNIQDLEETKQEIEAKIMEIEETQAQNIAEVRAALDSYIKPLSSGDVDAGSSKSATAASSSLTADDTSTFSSSSSAAITSSSKPTDISHLIKRKRPEDPTSEAEAAVACSPAKRPAV